MSAETLRFLGKGCFLPVPGRRSRGFTLIEVMAAVAILGLTAAGSLRLVAASVRSLQEVRSGREFLAAARSLRLPAAAGKLEGRGVTGAMTWERDRFDFSGQGDAPEGFFCTRIALFGGEAGLRQKNGKKAGFVLYVPEPKAEGE